MGGAFSILPGESLVRCAEFEASFLFSMFVQTLFSLTCLPTSNLGTFSFSLQQQSPHHQAMPHHPSAQGPSSPCWRSRIRPNLLHEQMPKKLCLSVTHHRVRSTDSGAWLSGLKSQFLYLLADLIFNLCVPQFILLQNGHNNSSYFIGLSERTEWIISHLNLQFNSANALGAPMYDVY